MVKWIQLKTGLLVFAVSLILLGPPLTMPLEGAGHEAPDEARGRAAAPASSLLWTRPGDYLRGVDAYLKDHFGFRDQALDLNATLRTYLGAPVSNKVVVGEAGWLFYAEGLLDRPREPSEHWRERVTQHAEMLAVLQSGVRRLGARLIVVPVPDKHTIYPEFLPSWLRSRQPRSIYGDFVRSLREREVDVLGVRDRLTQLKSRGPVYYRTDTHWTPLGALAAFNSVLEHLALSEHAIPLTLPTHERTARRYDLARMALFRRRFSDWEVTPYRSAKRDKRLVLDPAGPGPSTLQGYEATRAGSGLEVVVIGDSFSRSFLREPLLDIASRVVWIHHRWCKVDWNRIRREQPDVVLYQVVERYIGCSEDAAPKLERLLARES